MYLLQSLKNYSKVLKVSFPAESEKCLFIQTLKGTKEFETGPFAVDQYQRRSPGSPARAPGTHGAETPIRSITARYNPRRARSLAPPEPRLMAGSIALKIVAKERFCDVSTSLPRASRDPGQSPHPPPLHTPCRYLPAWCPATTVTPARNSIHTGQ